MSFYPSTNYDEIEPPTNALMNNLFIRSFFKRFNDENYEVYIMWAVMVITVLLLIIMSISTLIDIHETERFLAASNYHIL